MVSLPAHNDCGADPAHPVGCVDTAVAGPFFGPGGGVMIDSTSHFALTLSASALLGVLELHRTRRPRRRVAVKL